MHGYLEVAFPGENWEEFQVALAYPEAYQAFLDEEASQVASPAVANPEEAFQEAFREEIREEIQVAYQGETLLGVGLKILFLIFMVPHRGNCILNKSICYYREAF